MMRRRLLEVGIAKWRFRPPNGRGIPSMSCVIGDGASSAASITLRAIEELPVHAMQHVCARACIISRYDKLDYPISKLCK